MKRLTIIVGAGGTGSYFIPNIIRQYNRNFLDNKIIVLDGDFLEERNLLRQGFYKNVINYSKSEAIYKMHSRFTDTFIECKTQFLNYADDLITLIEEQNINFQEILLVSCVDNNLARLRLLLGQQLIKEVYPDKKVLFADSGNEEWFGQTILSYMDSDDLPFITFKNNEFKFIRENLNIEKVDTLFSHISDWKNHLTRGDHELSCDDVVESAPQNIATNMMASNVLLFSINKVFNKNTIKNVYFDCKMNLTKELNKSTKDELVLFFNELIEYLNSEDVSTVLSERFLNFNKNSESIYVKKPIKLETHKEFSKVKFENLMKEFVSKDDSNVIKKEDIKLNKKPNIEENNENDVSIEDNDTSNTSFDLNIDGLFDKILNTSNVETKKKENDFSELDTYLKSIDFEELFI